MDCEELKKNICRVCLDENVVLDWNSALYEYCDVTYKDCFFKYTQLENCAWDPFPSVLCQMCSNGLYNTHALVLKALKTQKYFQEINNNSSEYHFTNTENDHQYVPTEFETVLVGKIKTEPILQDHFLYENSVVETDIKTVKTRGGKSFTNYENETSKREKFKNKICVKEYGARDSNSEYKSPLETSKNVQIKHANSSKKQIFNQHKSNKKKVLKGDTSNYRSKDHFEVLQTELLEGLIKDSNVQVENNVKKKCKELKNPRMCSICSKILHNNYAVHMHEKTHIENRERKETCKVCGLKFYDKRNLYAHKRIHVENREKNHKCEFCNKAFYNKGGLNIHRRIHLGQMIPCNLCAKQFFRKIDLERHMGSHSATAINSDTRKRSRYFVRCKYCAKSILSTSFKSHTAAHLNEPLMKCSICSKEFFRRGSCVLHVKKVHQKTNEEYNDFIIQFTKNRISHLFLEQKADIQFTGE